MNLSAPFIQRPIATSLLMLLIVLLGLAGYALLPIAALPQVELPTIQVSAALPGASADIMASAVATPLERNLALISGLSEMTSTSARGKTSITLQFDLNRSIDSAAQDVQAAISASASNLPKTLPAPPTYEKANPADFQIMSLAVTSDVLPLARLDVYADSYIAQQLSRIRGVGLVDLHGEQKPAVRIQLNPDKITALGLSLEQIRAVIGNASVDAPKGTVDSPTRSVTVDATDQLLHASAYDALIIAYHKGAPLRIRDVGHAIDGVEDVNQRAWVGDHPAIIIDIHKQPGFNVVETVDAVNAALPGLQQALPAEVGVRVVGNRTQTIRAAVHDVQITLGLTVALVVLVVFLFLRGFWATVIPAIAIPISIIGTFGVMYVLGYSVDNLSLMGITIAVGFVVDDAIVVIENIMRHIEDGSDPLSAALHGAGEVGFTVISMTTSLIAAFIPLLFMGGIVGRLFREFAVTVSVALLVSAVVSLTLTPMMCRVFLQRAQVPTRPGLRVFPRLLAAYERSLDWVLRYPALMLGLTVAIAGVTVAVYWSMPKGFFPQQDSGVIMGTTVAATDIATPAMAQRQTELVRKLMADPDIDNIYSWVGPNPTLNDGRLVINLKPFAQRKNKAGDIIKHLRTLAAGTPGMDLFMQARQDVQIGGRASKTQFQYTLEDTDLQELYAWAPKLQARLSSLPELSEVASDLEDAAPRITVVIDRDLAAQFGISAQVIDDTLYDALGQRQVATLYTQIDQYHVVMEVDPAAKLDRAALARLYVPSSSGLPVPLTSVAHLVDSSMPMQISHQGQFPAVTLSFNLAPGVALGDAVTLVNDTIRQLGMPATVHGSFQGSAQAFQSSLASQPYLILAALLAVYIVLGILYESYIHPLTILSTLPSAGLGALLALMLCHDDLNVIALIGIILLIGIVKKNAIMMIDFALDAERRQQLDTAAAIRQACLLRFRPIMMTTMAAILGALPLAFGRGAGSELRAPLGIAIVGGLLVSQLLTLYTTPVIYLYLDRLNQWALRRVRVASTRRR